VKDYRLIIFDAERPQFCYAPSATLFLDIDESSGICEGLGRYRGAEELVPQTLISSRKELYDDGTNIAVHT